MQRPIAARRDAAVRRATSCAIRTCSARSSRARRFLVNQVLEPIDWQRAQRHRGIRPGRRHHHRRDPAPHAQRRQSGRHRDQSRLRALPASARCPTRGCTWCTTPPPRYRRSSHASGSRPRATSSPAFRWAACRNAVRADIVAKTRAALEPGGAFLVYQFTARVLPACGGPSATCGAASKAAICRRRSCSCVRRPALEGTPLICRVRHIWAPSWPAARAR